MIRSIERVWLALEYICAGDDCVLDLKLLWHETSLFTITPGRCASHGQNAVNSSIWTRRRTGQGRGVDDNRFKQNPVRIPAINDRYNHHLFIAALTDGLQVQTIY